MRTPKASKPRRHLRKPTVPSKKSQRLANLVLKAIRGLNEKNGSSMESILDYLQIEFGVRPNDVKQELKSIIANGIAFGAIKRNRKKFSLGSVIGKIELSPFSTWIKKSHSKTPSISDTASDKSLNDRTPSVERVY